MGAFATTSEMLEIVGKMVSGFIEALLEPEQSIEPDVNPVELAERKRRIQQIQQTQGLGR